ncbi:uncharacterized protein LOC111338408 [Stylophora pistillata]|uniref:uncharacterized protein LOC111338408 n=1 Tax=Stylophora pistillata TaxID=50429 RepID=UPI000C0407B2|nr:uncharacterized protein LOC111338408 [Stylophora pistillata]
MKELLHADIIEGVEGPTTWESSFFIARKPNGDIRLCVNMRRANEAIIELHPDCRDITTFLTHEGLFPCKRVSLGVNAAPEKYEHINRQVIADIHGVVNIADESVVHGKTVAEQDRDLHELLARLEDKSLTLNGGKRTFGLNKVVFMGILL